MVHEERRALVQDLQALEPPNWQTPSLCPDWDVHDVLAHLVDTAKTTRRSFIGGMLGARFDFDRDDAMGVMRERAEDPGATLAEFSTVLTRTSTPPAALTTRLVEAFVHGEDIRRPLDDELNRLVPVERGLHRLDSCRAVGEPRRTHRRCARR
ncbi:MAG: maleylpyruvate isomerase family mycothiol-dependent enzyme [Mycobacteriaceae bacterium]